MTKSKLKLEKDYKPYPDRGDRWKDTYKSLSTLDYRVKEFFVALMKIVDEYNKKFGKNFVVFEARRNVNRQGRLVKKGVSWVASISKAPHVQGRAIDIVELVGKKYIWNSKDLVDLRNYIEKNFKFAYLLRKRIKKDGPHYELERYLFNKLIKENKIIGEIEV